MAEEVTVETLLQRLTDQAAQIALLITQNSGLAAQIKLHIGENARLKKRIEQLERQVKRYVAPHSREAFEVDLKPPGQRAGHVSLTQSALNQATTRTTATGTPVGTAYQGIKTAVQSSPVVHQDDTGWRIHGLNAWLQVACNPQHGLFQIRTRHTYRQLTELLGETFGGTLVADLYTVYDHAVFTGWAH